MLAVGPVWVCRVVTGVVVCVCVSVLWWWRCTHRAWSQHVWVVLWHCVCHVLSPLIITVSLSAHSLGTTSVTPSTTPCVAAKAVVKRSFFYLIEEGRREKNMIRKMMML